MGQKNERPRVTLRHLAQSLHLSPTTVSRALNGFPEVGEATRQRVETAARALGYLPDRSARRLANGVAGAFGIVFPASDKRLIDPLFAEFIGGVAEFTARAEIEITLQAVPPDDELEAYRRAAAQRSVDGFIVSSPYLDDPRIVELSKLNVPFVVHGRSEVATSYPWLDIANRAGFEHAARLLANYGHRRIALIGGDRSQTFARDRYRGLLDGLRASGLGAEAATVHDCPMTEEMGYRMGSGAFDQPRNERPTAFLCSSIFIALGVQRAGRERGLYAPGDFSIIAHDDRPPYLRSEFFDPPLTATQSSIRRAGQRVGEMLQARISGTPAEALQEEWPCDLVLRDSVGRA